MDKTAGGSVTLTVTHYPTAGAMRINSTLYYILKDHLGSASVMTDSSGILVTGASERYYPFGEKRLNGSMLTDKLFTGQREITDLGIYHFGAQFYSPKLARFLSADTIVSNPANPQDLNRFSYVRNNPLRYTDGNGGFGWVTTPVHPGGGGGGGYTPTPTPSPTPTPTPTPTPSPTPTPTVTSAGTPPSSFTQNSSTQSSPNMGSAMCSTNPDGCIVGGALLIIFTDLFVGLPAFAVIVLSGGVTPPAIAAEVIETVVVLPVNIFGLYLITQGLEVKNDEE